jgi:hypothetical protein
MRPPKPFASWPLAISRSRSARRFGSVYSDDSSISRDRYRRGSYASAPPLTRAPAGQPASARTAGQLSRRWMSCCSAAQPRKKGTTRKQRTKRQPTVKRRSFQDIFAAAAASPAASLLWEHKPGSDVRSLPTAKDRRTRGCGAGTRGYDRGILGSEPRMRARGGQYPREVSRYPREVAEYPRDVAAYLRKADGYPREVAAISA